MQSHEERAEEMLRSAGGSMAVWSQRNALIRMILAEDKVADLEQAASVGPQPDEMSRLLEALDTAESVAQMAAHDRDEALENFVRVEQEYAQLLAERDRLKRLLDQAYPWLHNPYTPRLDARLCAQFDAMKREIEVVISHMPEIDDDNERVALPCASCDGSGKVEIGSQYTMLVACPNCTPRVSEG